LRQLEWRESMAKAMCKNCYFGKHLTELALSHIGCIRYPPTIRSQSEEDMGLRDFTPTQRPLMPADS
ncbi:MAG: hypothetical protein ACKVKR_11750, partial [Pseudomonadales bacterium]